MDQRIDSGDILYQEIQPIVFRSSLGQTIAGTLEMVVSSVPSAVRLVCEDYARFAASAQSQSGRLEVYSSHLPAISCDVLE